MKDLSQLWSLIVIDIKSYLQRTPPQSRKGDGVSVYHKCPFCGGEKKLEHHTTRGVWFCHKCRRKGNVKGRSEGSKEVEGVLGEDWFFNTVSRESPHFQYVVKRTGSLTLADILHPHYGPSPTMVYFPCYPLYSKVPHYFVGRSILSEPMGQKHWVPPTGMFGPLKGEILWGLQRIRMGDSIVICEGVFDAIHFDKGVALLGKNITERQGELIERIRPKEITVMMDGGVSFGMTAHRLVGRGPKVFVIDLPAGRDPDSYGKDAKKWLARRKAL